jgi:hypothetical protein
MAHAVVMQVRLPVVGDSAQAQQMLEERIVPHAKSQPGFIHGTWLHDGSHGGMGVIVFDTAANAEAAMETLKPPPGGPELISTGVWEIGTEA